MASLQDIALGRKLILILHFTFFITYSQAQTLVGSWVGVKQEIDSGFACPLPVLLQVHADGTYQLSLIDDAAAAPESTWSMEGGTIRLDTATYAAKHVRLTNKELAIQSLAPMLFRRLEQPTTAKTTALPLGDALKTYLSQRVWHVGKTGVRYHFHPGGQACIEQPNGNRAIRCWTTAFRDGATFVVVKGNRVDCSRNYDPPMQVLEAKAQHVQVMVFDDKTTGPVSLSAGALLPTGNCEGVGFQLCSSCFYEPYNQASDLAKKGPPGGFYAVKQRLLADFKPIDGSDNTGLVQVRCRVNCEGQAGQFTITSYDATYQRCQFSTAITDQLLTILKTHFSTGWQPGRFREHDATLGSMTMAKRPLDYVAVIHIRLVDGAITDVYP